MKPVFTSYSNIISALGFTSKQNIENVKNEVSGLKKYPSEIIADGFYSSMIDDEELNKHFSKIGDTKAFTKLEKMMISSLKDVMEQVNIPLNEKTALIISTTKGNVDCLDEESPFDKSRAYLHELGKVLQNFFEFKNEPIIISNACVSGILAVAVAKRYIQNGIYDNVLVVSGDTVSNFVLSGFNSFQAISNEPCKPFSKNRAGINIGEASASILITSDKKLLSADAMKIIGDGSCNDANHISGPSRTGEGLFKSIQSALSETKINADQIDYISAHGTATNYNDEMESIAFDRLQLGDVPLNSLKGYYGHTLGASGLLETIIGIGSLHQNTLFTSLGFDEIGVSKNISVIADPTPKEMQIFLKTASGFGGCNTAVLFEKAE